ncbi:glycosyltransferase family 2 protein [Flavobacterium sp.]|jgi:glycosyltransferase involved in cell wall biosynthesis|uniref:glycosyltransferase family 2 protein n=1 Tax=Flavobacterium sp. TaxID=239 RepID=UPI00391C3EE4
MKLSVAMCTYNGDEFIKQQLDSILKQSVNVDEIIICDDGSSDSTIEIINDYIEKFPLMIYLHKNEICLKSVKNFEKAINLCTGDIIFLSDQDDIWVENKVKDYLQYFNDNQNINVIGSNGYCIDENSNVIDKYSLWDIPNFLNEQNITYDYFKMITHFGNIFTGASMAFRKCIIPDVMPFPNFKNYHHDGWIATIAASKGEIVMLNDKYFYYRIHSKQQVGGVFFDKTEKQKDKLSHIYDIHKTKLSFYILTKKLKKLSLSYYDKLKIIEEYPKYGNLFNNNKTEILNNYKNVKKIIKTKYPLRFFILNIFDKIFHKRQIKV